MAEPRRLLIVGGLGYIGARLAATLTEFPEVVVTARSSTPARERWLAASGGRIRAVSYDSARDALLPVDGAFDAVLNVALPSAAAAGRDPEGSQRAALQTTRACLRLVAEGRARRLLHFSTFHVYGATPRPVFDEADAPEPQHPYGRNHLACERVIATEGKAGAIAVLRATNIIGAPAHGDLGDQAKLLFLDLCRQAVQERTLTLNNDGSSYRDFIAFADVLAAVRALLAAPAPLPGEPMNLGRGAATRLDEMARDIESVATRTLGAPVGVRFGTGKDAWREPFRVTNARLRAFGWSPATPLADEIAPTLEFFRGLL